MNEKGGAARDGGEERHGGRLMLLVLIGLTVVALGLGVGIYFIRHSNDGDSVSEVVTDSLSAFETNERIMNKFTEEAEYGFEDAVSEYEAEMDNGDNEYKVYMAIYYADFAYTQTYDLEQSVGIMQKVEEILDNDELKSTYYAEMRQLYLYDGDEEQAEIYNQKVIESLPQGLIIEEVEE